MLPLWVSLQYLFCPSFSHFRGWLLGQMPTSPWPTQSWIGPTELRWSDLTAASISLPDKPRRPRCCSPAASRYLVIRRTFCLSAGMNHAPSSEVWVVFINCDAAVYIFTNAENKFKRPQETIHDFLCLLCTVVFFSLEYPSCRCCFVFFIVSNESETHLNPSFSNSSVHWANTTLYLNNSFRFLWRNQWFSLRVRCVAVGDLVRYSTKVQQSKTFLIGAQPTAQHSLKHQSPVKPTEHFLFLGCCFQFPH